MQFSQILKPEYLYQPRLLWRRLAGSRFTGWTDFQLPWGWPITARADEVHGRMLARLGVADLPITEVLWRLIDANEIAVDVGANIGCMSAVMIAKSQPQGAVWAFEPQPGVFQRLTTNADRWRLAAPNVKIELRPWAVADRPGMVEVIPSPDPANEGMASVSAVGAGNTPAESLDHLFGADSTLGLVKIDVEGNELAVLEGARGLLAAKRIRDIVFEEHAAYPTPVTSLLASLGYQLFRIHRSFWGPVLLPGDSTQARSTWEPTNFLATANPARAVDRCRPRGWQALTTRC